MSSIFPDPADYRSRLKQARALIEAGRLDEAETALDALAADPAAQGGRSWGGTTLLGTPRKLHSAYLKLAKARRDPVRRAGLQYSLVPDPAVIADLVQFDESERRQMTELSRRPVPRIIHQIWLGELAVPVATQRWAEHAQARGYDYILWREADLDRLGVRDHPAYRSMLADGDYPGAVDVARYAALEAFGGIYIDCDWYPARNDLGFDDLLPLVGLGALAEAVPRETGFGSLLLANSLIAAPAAHPAFGKLLSILPKIIEAMPDAPAWWSTGPLAMTAVFRQTSVFVAPPHLVAAEFFRGAPLPEVEAAALKAGAEGDGLLIAWKSW